jgi:hypothetical protein
VSEKAHPEAANRAKDSTAHTAEIIKITLGRRKYAGGAIRRGIDLRLALDQLEDEHNLSSAIAMIRIREGRLVHPTWEKVFTEYRKLARAKP